MTKTAQTVKLENPYGMANWRGFEWHDNDHKPSWKIYGEGSANLKVEYCTGRGILQIQAHEFDSKTNHTKEVHITLNDESAAALADFIEGFRNHNATKTEAR